MQLSDPQTGPLLFLTRLPKNRSILDYVLSRLSRDSSPERYELLEHIIDLHLTSAGFDPTTLARGRFKRMRAAEFRQQLYALDAEVALVMTSEEYRQVAARQALLPEQFDRYIQASEQLQRTDHFDPEAFETFAEKMADADAWELLCAFIRQHDKQFTELLTEQQLEGLIESSGNYAKAARRLDEISRIRLFIRYAELQSQRGISNTAALNDHYNSIQQLYTEELNAFRKPDLLELWIRCAVLCQPSAVIASVLTLDINSHADTQKAHSADELIRHAQYLQDISAVIRYELLDEAEALSRSLHDHASRAFARLLRSWIAADTGDALRAMHYLDESEHLIHRISDRNASVKNTWITVCLTRLYLTMSMVMAGDPFHAEIFDAQIFLAQDAGRHRKDMQVFTSLMSGMKSFLQQSWNRAAESFGKVSAHAEAQPAVKLTADAFIRILDGHSPAEQSVALQARGDLLYSTMIPALLQQAHRCYQSAIRESETG